MTTTTRRPRDPKLRTHKQSGRHYARFSNPANLDPETGSIESWVVWFGGARKGNGTFKDHTYDQRAKREFEAYKARWILNDYRDPDEVEGTGGAANELTVRELVDRYREHLRKREGDAWFARNGRRFELAIGTTNGRNARGDSLLLRLYGETLAAEFGPKRLKAVRQAMLDAGTMCRETLNTRVGVVKALFVWAGEDELIPVSVAHGVKLVKGLGPGAYRVREGTGRRNPVDDCVVNATTPHLPTRHAAAVRLLRITGARPAELFKLTPTLIDRDGEVWSARISEHKTARHGHERELVFGPKAQAILRPLLSRDGPMFREPTVNADEATKRLTREICRAVKRANQERATELLQIYWATHGEIEARRLLREEYRVTRYSRQRMGCARDLVSKLGDGSVADLVKRLHGEPVPPWTSYQLRHSRLSEVRREFGIEGAAAIGGHSLGKEVRITEGYTMTAQRRLAREIAQKTG